MFELTTKEKDVLQAFGNAAKAGKQERTVAVVAGDLGVLTDLCQRQQEALAKQATRIAELEPTDLET